MRHTWVGTSDQPSSPKDEFSRTCQWFDVRPVPCPVTMASGPYSAAMRLQLSASRSSASSQVMRSHFPSPRAPARFMGYRMRPSTLLWISRCDMPAPHTTPNDFGFSGSPSILTMLLSSSEYTKTPHRAWQVVHCVLVFLIAIAAPSFVRELVRADLEPPFPRDPLERWRGGRRTTQSARRTASSMLRRADRAVQQKSVRTPQPPVGSRRVPATDAPVPRAARVGDERSRGCRPAAGGNRRTGRCAPCGRALDLL